MAKTKVRNDIINGKCRTPSKRIRSPLEVAQHLRATFSTGKWLQQHQHMKINEVVVMYIDKDEITWPDPEPVYGTLTGISSAYCFDMLGGGRVAKGRLSCWCPACCRAFERDRKGMDACHRIANCARGHLTCFEAHTITSTVPADRGAAKRRAQELWARLKSIIAAGKVVCVQARELWSEEERTHLRPGHFWLALLGDAGEGSPIIAGPFAERTYWPPKEGESGWEDRFKGIERQRYDVGDCALLLCHYYHRVPDDPEGLMFVGWAAKPGEKLVVNSCEVRGLTGNPLGHWLVAMAAAKKKKKAKKMTHTKKGAKPPPRPLFDPKERLHLNRDVDAEMRKRCEGVSLI